jgi:hypothetical protein
LYNGPILPSTLVDFTESGNTDLEEDDEKEFDLNFDEMIEYLDDV